MIYVDLLKRLDEIRSKIRQNEDFQKKPRSVAPAYMGEWFRELAAAVEEEQGPQVITLELGPDGKPIIPSDLSDLFATAPEETQPTPGGKNPNKGTGVTRRNPVLASSSIATQEENKMKAVMLPRETPHVNHPVSLDDADESTVAK